MTTAQIAIQMPFASQELNQEGGGYYGQSKQSGNLVICNRKKLASPMGFVCGKPGSGKSFSVKREITNTILALSRGRGHRLRPGGRVRARRRGARRHCIRVLAGRRHVHEPLRPLRRRRQGQTSAAGLQDRRVPGALERDHGRGARGAAGGRQVDHQPLRGAGLPAREGKGRRPSSATSTTSLRAAARARGPRHRAALRALREGRALVLQPPEQRRLRRAASPTSTSRTSRRTCASSACSPSWRRCATACTRTSSAA